MKSVILTPGGSGTTIETLWGTSAQVRRMAKAGATIQQIAQATGWLDGNVRTFLASSAIEKRPKIRWKERAEVPCDPQ